MGKMARCDICTMAIRKADVQERYRLWNGHMELVTVHPEGGCKKNLVGNSRAVGHANEFPGRLYLPVTTDLTAVHDALDRQHAFQERSRKLAAEREKAANDDRARYICRLELETDRHGSKPCGAPDCPVTALFAYVPPSAYDAYRRKSSGYHRCNMCGKVASEDNSGRECHSCEDWGGCGGNCTLVAVYCETCGTREAA